MGVQIDKYNFEGPYKSLNKLKNKPGIYAIHGKNNDHLKLIDIGEAAMIRDRIKTHERMKCWFKYNYGHTITVSVYYTKHWNQGSRMKVVRKLRHKLSPPCGKKTDGNLFFLQDM